jgi:hypothetical protein
MLPKNEKFISLNFDRVPKIIYISKYLMNLLTKRMISNVLKNRIEIHSLFLLNNLLDGENTRVEMSYYMQH